MTLTKWAAIFAILAAVLVVAAVLISGDTPEGDAPAQEWVDYIEEDETAVLIRAYLFIAAGLSLVALFSLGIRPRLGAADATDQSLGRLGAGSTLLAAAALAGAGLVGAAVGAAHKFGDVPIDPNTAALFDNLLFGFMVVGAALPMAVVMAVVAIQTRRRAAFPQWIMWVSILGILGMLVSLIFVPFILLPIWLIAMAVALFRAPEPAMAMAMADGMARGARV